MSAQKTFETVYRELLSEIYDAEQQMLEGMPRMIRASASEELRAALELHMAETAEQAARLETIFASFDGPAARELSDTMRALIAKSRLQAVRFETSPAGDAALIATARQIEHYEIAAYGSAVLLARMLSHTADAELLRQSLKEEQETSSDLTQIAETVIMGEELEDAVLEEQ